MSADGPPPLEEQLQRIEIPEPLRQSVMDYYRRYDDFYAEPWRELDETRRRFEGANRDLRTSMFVLSYLYTVLTIKTRINEAEREFATIYEDGVSVQTEVINSSQITKKAELFYATLDRYGYDGMASLADDIANGRVEQVVEEMDKEFGYIGPVKAPFLVAQLGYTSKMCIDGNMQDFLGLELGNLNITGEDITRICTTVEELFPELLREVREPYHLQWTLFNFARIHDVMWEPNAQELTLDLSGNAALERIEGLEPEKHDRWFDAALDTEERIVQRVDGIFREANVPGARRRIP